ncbi:MAG: hypothetical protein J0H98_00730 [Solirubrobacterales bacterium]|nr:hypothetical protein [Solirubrobacterales bacterium]
MSGKEALLETRREEAIAFFHVNQAARTAAERVIALIFSVSAIAASIGAAAETLDVVIPLPALIFLLLSYMFQQYADLTTIGVTRRRLEDEVNAELGGHKGLVYETAVAEIRKKPPLVFGVRLLQTMLGLVALSATILAAKVALDGHDSLVIAGFAAGTAVTLASASWSFLDMHRSERETIKMLERQNLGGDRMVWIPEGLYAEALGNANRDELERETFVRLVKTALMTPESRDGGSGGS